MSQLTVKIRDYQAFAQIFDYGLETLLALAQDLLLSPAMSDVLNCQQDHGGAALFSDDLAGVQQDDSHSDAREHMIDLEAIELCVRGKDLFEQGSQGRDVPLPIAQFVDQAAFGLRFRNAEGPVERAAGARHAQVGIENDERLAHRLDDVLEVIQGSILSQSQS